jgi:hypothetical protein
MNSRIHDADRPPLARMLREVAREVLRGLPPLTAARIAFIRSGSFTRSTEWARLRYAFLRDHEGRCRSCGRGAADGLKVNVDHILPRKTHPEFALAYANLQVLCGPCNRGKGNRDRTDWRFSRRRAAPVPPPTCVRCQVPMLRRDGARGPFWGCPGFPVCRETRPIDREPARSGTG